MVWRGLWESCVIRSNSNVAANHLSTVLFLIFFSRGIFDKNTDLFICSYVDISQQLVITFGSSWKSQNGHLTADTTDVPDLAPLYAHSLDQSAADNANKE